MQTLSTPEILAAITDGLGDWRKLAQSLSARYRAPDTAAGAEFVGLMAGAAAVAGHGVPEIRLGGEVVDVSLFSVDEATGGRWVTAADLELARVITGLARANGLTAHPGQVAQVELGLDTADDAAVAPFWSALLTGDAGNTVFDSVLDPTNRVPNVWFQRSEAHEAPRQRWHLDLWLAPEVADERIAAAVAAGGAVLDDAEAPSFTVLADPDGNKVCVCTALDRD